MLVPTNYTGAELYNRKDTGTRYLNNLIKNDIYRFFKFGILAGSPYMLNEAFNGSGV